MMRCVTAAAALALLFAPAAGQTTRPNDPGIVKMLTELPPGRVLKLPPFKVVGDGIEGDAHFAKRGPMGRDYGAKMCYAPGRRAALYAGANHGAPSRLNDCWEYHLGSNTWVRLARGDGGDQGRLTRARQAIQKGNDAEKNQAFLKQWYEQHAEVAGGYLRTRRNHGPVEPWHTWDGLAWDASAHRLLWAVLDTDKVMAGKLASYASATGRDPEPLKTQLRPGTGLYLFDPAEGKWQRQLGDDPRPYLRGMGGSLTYIPEWKKTVWYCAAQNVTPNDFAMWTYDATANRWQELKPNGGKSIRALWGEKLAPRGEVQMAYSSRHGKLVAVSGKDTWVYDIRANAWSHATTEPGQYAHDAVTVFDYDGASDLFLLLNATTGHWGKERELRAFDLKTNRWRTLPADGASLNKPDYVRMTGYYDPTFNVFVVYGRDIRVYRAARATPKPQEQDQ